jgi:hypothetical protein
VQTWLVPDEAEARREAGDGAVVIHGSRLYFYAVSIPSMKIPSACVMARLRLDVGEKDIVWLFGYAGI